MTVIKPRSRMNSVRLSEEEYIALRHLCSLTGARSVSDLTRDAVNTVLKEANRDESFTNNLEEFRTGMKNLEKKLSSWRRKSPCSSPRELTEEDLPDLMSLDKSHT